MRKFTNLDLLKDFEIIISKSVKIVLTFIKIFTSFVLNPEAILLKIVTDGFLTVFSVMTIAKSL